MFGAALAFAGAHKRLFTYLAIGLAVVGLVASIYARGVHKERERQEAARAVAIVEAMKTDAKAHEKAAETRLQDAAETAKLREDLTNAVADLPDALPSARRIARACEQLRQQGDDTSKLAACGGSGGAAKAAPVP